MLRIDPADLGSSEPCNLESITRIICFLPKRQQQPKKKGRKNVLCILCTSLFPLQNWLSKWIRSARFKSSERSIRNIGFLKILSRTHNSTSPRLAIQISFTASSRTHYYNFVTLSSKYVELNNQWLAVEKIIPLDEKLTYVSIISQGTFRLMNVNTAPSNPPMIPRITVGMKARMFKPMPWLIWNWIP